MIDSEVQHSLNTKSTHCEGQFVWIKKEVIIGELILHKYYVDLYSIYYWMGYGPNLNRVQYPT